tara:strand:- start:9208 stop:9417 length:210 start_codon:yes stop_codon:yes gene_type:complete
LRQAEVLWRFLAVLETLGIYDSKNKEMIDEKFWSTEAKNIMKKARAKEGKNTFKYIYEESTKKNKEKEN